MSQRGKFSAPFKADRTVRKGVGRCLPSRENRTALVSPTAKQTLRMPNVPPLSGDILSGISQEHRAAHGLETPRLYSQRSVTSGLDKYRSIPENDITNNNCIFQKSDSNPGQVMDSLHTAGRNILSAGQTTSGNSFTPEVTIVTPDVSQCHVQIHETDIYQFHLSPDSVRKKALRKRKLRAKEEVKMKLLRTIEKMVTEIQELRERRRVLLQKKQPPDQAAPHTKTVDSVIKRKTADSHRKENPLQRRKNKVKKKGKLRKPVIVKLGAKMPIKKSRLQNES